MEGLRDFIECFVGLKGKWWSPGGSTKQFTTCDMDLNISWYAKKQNSLTFSGEDSDLLRDRLVQLCVDRELLCSKALGLQNNDQSSCSTVSTDVVPQSYLSNDDGLLSVGRESHPCVCGCNNSETLADFKNIQLRQNDLKKIIKSQDQVINTLQQKCLFFESKFESFENLMFNDPQLYASPHSDGAFPTEAEPQISENVSGIKNHSTLLGAVSNEENCIEKLSNKVILNDFGNNALSHAPINRVNLIDKSPPCVSKQLPDLNNNSGLLSSENVSGVIEKDESTCSNDQSVNSIINNVEQTASQREDELNRLRN